MSGLSWGDVTQNLLNWPYASACSSHNLDVPQLPWISDTAQNQTDLFHTLMTQPLRGSLGIEQRGGALI